MKKNLTVYAAALFFMFPPAQAEAVTVLPSSSGQQILLQSYAGETSFEIPAGNTLTEANKPVSGDNSRNWLVVNRGTVSATAGGSSTGLLLGAADKTATIVENYGSIISAGTVSTASAGIRFINGGQVFNFAGGYIEGFDGIHTDNGSILVENSGIIYGNNGGGSAIYSGEGALIRNFAGGQITGVHYGVHMNGSKDGSIYNDGVISTPNSALHLIGGGVYGLYNGPGGFITSSNAIPVFFSGTKGQMVNYGTIVSPTRTAIQSDSHGDIYVNAGQIIAGGASGNGILVTGDNNRVYNLGSISGSGSGESIRIEGDNSLVVLGQHVFLPVRQIDVTGPGSTLVGDVVSTGLNNQILLTDTGQENAAGFIGFDSLTMNGQSWSLGNSFSLASTSQDSLSVQSGELILNGTVSTAGGSTVYSGGTLRIVGTANIAGDSVLSGGTMLVDGTATIAGNSLVYSGGLLSIAGDASVGGNSAVYSGGTLRIAGTADIAGDSVLSGGTMLVDGTATIAGSSLVYSGGLLSIAGAASVGGDSVVYSGGTLLIGDANSPGATLTSPGATLTSPGATLTSPGGVLVERGGILGGTGTLIGSVVNSGRITASGLPFTIQGNVQNSGIIDLHSDVAGNILLIQGNVQNHGIISLLSGALGKNLLIQGDYHGAPGSALLAKARLSGDFPASDYLLVDGGSITGVTRLYVRSLGGTGTATMQRVPVVLLQNGAMSAPDSFVLGRAVIGGLSEFELIQDPASQEWFLQNAGRHPEAGAYLSNAYAATRLLEHSFYDRQGPDGQKHAPYWINVSGGSTEMEAAAGQNSLHMKDLRVQAGVDILSGSLWNADAFQAGLMGSYGEARNTSRVRGNGRTSDGNVESCSLGVYGTWFEDGEKHLGTYVDSWLQYGWQQNSVQGNQMDEQRYHSQTFAASLELGYAIPLVSEKLVLTPQAQATWTSYMKDTFTAPESDITIRDRGAESWHTRLGARLHGDMAFANGIGLRPFVEGNWLYTQKDTGVSFDQESLFLQVPNHQGEAKAGLSVYGMSGVEVWAQAETRQGENNYRSIGGTVGFSVEW